MWIDNKYINNNEPKWNYINMKELTRVRKMRSSTFHVLKQKLFVECFNFCCSFAVQTKQHKKWTKTERLRFSTTIHTLLQLYQDYILVSSISKHEAIAYITKAHENHNDADDLTLAIMAFVAFYKFIDGDEIKDDEKDVVIMYWKDRIETVYSGTWGDLIEKYKI